MTAGTPKVPGKPWRLFGNRREPAFTQPYRNTGFEKLRERDDEPVYSYCDAVPDVDARAWR
jgi:hypothetical protein